ncbi:DUF1330 domain-containing protein [Sphingomonas gei]|nr:DUF1330 domain-containing protein [Sphingomonas gei]
MAESAVLVVIEIVSVEDPAGLQTYAQRASALIGSFGGQLVAQGGVPVDEGAAFAPLVIQRWPSEAAFRAWIASDAYRPLNELRLASATMKAAIVPTSVGPDAA